MSVLETIVNMTFESVKDLIKPSQTDTKFYPNESQKKGIYDCVVYGFVPLLNDGIKGQARFTVDCFSTDYLKAHSMVDQLDNLVTIGSTPLTDEILEVSHDGGGEIYNSDTEQWKVKAIYTVKYRR
nr:hypothetical protein [uncultured Cellulosilyticum sp.]